MRCNSAVVLFVWSIFSIFFWLFMHSYNLSNTTMYICHPLNLYIPMYRHSLNLFKQRCKYDIRYLICSALSLSLMIEPVISFIITKMNMFNTIVSGQYKYGKYQKQFDLGFTPMGFIVIDLFICQSVKLFSLRNKTMRLSVSVCIKKCFFRGLYLLLKRGIIVCSKQFYLANF